MCEPSRVLLSVGLTLMILGCFLAMATYMNDMNPMPGWVLLVLGFWTALFSPNLSTYPHIPDGVNSELG